ncbi:MAG TPA: beta-N-acetylhexosaminidase [Limnochordia bacterium]|nr:beta-N-acetylhexosaminidase [Limnochordia bacterium]
MNETAFGNLIPRPVRAEWLSGVFSLGPDTKISVPAGLDAARESAQYLACVLGALTGLPLPVLEGAAPRPGCIHLTDQGAPEGLGDEGYLLEAAGDRVVIRARQYAGFFYGCQTLRQLLPPRRGPWQLPGVAIEDYPRFAWRGAMLDVARSFFPVPEVKRLIDLLAGYKINRLHLHLSDDQGWRIMINSWPKLALYGGRGAVEGGRSGYYTQAEFKDLAAYARSRAMLLVPEIDLPGHTTAVLASYPELNRDGTAPELYRGMKVGFSTLAAEKEITYRFATDVLGELAQLTPGPYLHVGGDEAHSTTLEEYKLFLGRLHDLVAQTGKTLVGWDEIIQGGLRPGDVVQIWRKEAQPLEAVRQGARVIMSPCHHAYLDMKYAAGTKLGQDWAALIEVADAYAWDPVSVYPGLSEGDVLGVEAALWTETIHSLKAAEYMLFPRILGIAEIGWSPRQGRSWAEYRRRLARHGPRLQAADVHFYRSPQVPWEED